MAEDMEIIEERFYECIMVIIGCAVFIVFGYVLRIPLKLFLIPGLLLVLEIGVFIRDYRALKKAGVRDVYRFFIESKGAKDIRSNRYRHITIIIVFLAIIISGYLLKADPMHTSMWACISVPWTDIAIRKYRKLKKYRERKVLHV